MRLRTKIPLRGRGTRARTLEVFRVLADRSARLVAKMAGTTRPEAALARRPRGLYRLVYTDEHGQVVRRSRHRVGFGGLVVEIRALPRALRRPEPKASVSAGTVIANARVAPTKSTPGTHRTWPSETTPSTVPVAKPVDVIQSPPERPTVTAPLPASPLEPRTGTPPPPSAVPPDTSPSERLPRPGYDDVLPRRLRMLLDATGISQAELARVAQLNVSHVNDICTGRRRDPSIRTVAAIARAAGCSCDWLIGLADRGPIPAEVRAAFVNAGGRLRAQRARRS